MRKLADLKDISSWRMHIDKEHCVTYQNNDSYNAFNMFFNAIKDGFDMEFHPYCDGVAYIIKISKNGLYETHDIISDISDEEAVILEVNEFIKYATGEINKKIDNY